MTRLAATIFLVGLLNVSMAAEHPSALTAMKVLPKQELRNLARIVAHEGSPEPQRWHFLVYDPNALSGVREYIVQGGELETSRGISQFADKLTDGDVVNDQTIRIDSDLLVRLAKDFSEANNIPIGTLNYHLMKDQKLKEPFWWVSCINNAGQAMGTLVVSAISGNVVSFQGFPTQPKNKPPEPSEEARDPDWRSTEASPKPEKPKPSSQVAATTNRKKTTTTAAAKPRSERKKTAVVTSSAAAPSRREIRRPPPPVAEMPRRRNSLGDAFRRLLRF